MIVILLLVIIAILLFGAAAIRSAIGMLIAAGAGVIVLAFALTLSATFWITTAAIVGAAVLGLVIVAERQKRKLIDDTWAIYEPHVAQMPEDVVRRATAARDAGDREKMSAILQRGMETRR